MPRARRSHQQEVVGIGDDRRLLGDEAVEPRQRAERLSAIVTASGRRIASLNGVTCSTAGCGSRHHVGELGDDDRNADRRADVADQRPQRRAFGAQGAGRVAKAMVLSGTKTKPSPTP